MSKLSGVKVLVTGGAGFIGSHLCEGLLEIGAHVVCADNFLSGYEENLQAFRNHPNFTLERIDIRDPRACARVVQGCPLVLHQAALGSVPRSIADPLTTNDINVTGFVNMLVAAREAKVKRFVFASSSSVYGDSKAKIKSEGNLGSPLSPYAVTKLVNEHYGSTFRRLHDMEILGLRYFNVFGPRQSPEGQYAAVIPKFIQALIRRQSPKIYGDGSQSRDFTYVKDVVRANLLALTTPRLPNTAAVNIAAGRRTTLNDLFLVLRRMLAKQDPAIAKIEATRGEVRQGDIKHSLASIAAAKKGLGYTARYTVEKGLRESIEWYWKKYSVAPLERDAA